MATLKILVPDGTTNYVYNPSLRHDTIGWTAAGATLTRVLTRARFGIASLRVVTNGSALNEGAFFRVSNLTNVSEPITVSAYVRGTGTVRIRVISTAGPQSFSANVDLLDTCWTRIYATGLHNGRDDIRVYIETNGPSASARTFYVDGVQMERKPYPTTYADGEQPGCRWNGVAHNSRSIRDPYTRAGGRWVTVGGPEREEDNLYMTVVGGMGLAPLTLNIQPYGDSPGSYFQNEKVEARQVTFTFHAKNKDLDSDPSPVSLSKLHQLRQMLIDIVKPDRTYGGEEFTLEYQDGAFPLYLKARYDGGLEGEWDIRNQWINSFPLRLLAVSPFFVEDSQEVASLDFQNWEPKMNYMIQRVDGEWKMMNYGFDNLVQKVKLGRRGEVFVGGWFTHANNDPLAIDPQIFANCIAYFDGDQWQRVSTGVLGVGASVLAVALAPNGDIYIAGRFTSVGGVAANNIAKWNGSAWSALGSGLTHTTLQPNVFALEVAPNGDVYAGGQFNRAGGNPAYHVARWDGGTWHSLGIAGGLNSGVRAINISPDGLSVYVGGAFTDEFGATADNFLRVAVYDVTTNRFEALGDGFDDEVYSVILSESGLLYAGGDFTLSGLQSIPHIGVWNGAIWQPLGSGINSTVYSIALTPDGDIMATGGFTEAGGAEASSVALWNGSNWVALDIIPNGAILDGLIHPGNGNIYLAGEGDVVSGDSTAYFSGVTLVDNSGTAEVSPIIYILGQGTLRWIENWTTRKRMFLELDILDDEEVFIDFGRAQIRSTVRGDLSHRVLSGSDFKAFTLVPGENKIIAFMTHDVGAYMQISYQPTHWGADATGPIEEL